MSTTAVPQLLRLDEVADRLGMSRRGVYALVEKGELRPIHLDRRPKFLEADVAALVERALAQAEPDGANIDQGEQGERVT